MCNLKCNFYWGKSCWNPKVTLFLNWVGQIKTNTRGSPQRLHRVPNLYLSEQWKRWSREIRLRPIQAKTPVYGWNGVPPWWKHSLLVRAKIGHFPETSLAEARLKLHEVKQLRRQGRRQVKFPLNEQNAADAPMGQSSLSCGRQIGRMGRSWWRCSWRSLSAEIKPALKSKKGAEGF